MEEYKCKNNNWTYRQLEDGRIEYRDSYGNWFGSDWNDKCIRLSEHSDFTLISPPAPEKGESFPIGTTVEFIGNEPSHKHWTGDIGTVIEPLAKLSEVIWVDFQRNGKAGVKHEFVRSVSQTAHKAACAPETPKTEPQLSNLLKRDELGMLPNERAMFDAAQKVRETPDYKREYERQLAAATNRDLMSGGKTALKARVYSPFAMKGMKWAAWCKLQRKRE